VSILIFIIKVHVSKEITFLATPVCESPEELFGYSVTVSGYTPPAVKGTTVTFHCPSGAVLDGINSSTCMENGEWEPAPFEINCLLGLVD
jgi:hypothetical protein